jgi:hypothetical protein
MLPNRRVHAGASTLRCKNLNDAIAYRRTRPQSPAKIVQWSHTRALGRIQDPHFEHIAVLASRGVVAELPLPSRTRFNTISASSAAFVTICRSLDRNAAAHPGFEALR